MAQADGYFRQKCVARLRFNSGADARRVSGLQGADHSERPRRPRTRDRAEGHAVVVESMMVATKKRAEN